MPSGNVRSAAPDRWPAGPRRRNRRKPEAALGPHRRLLDRAEGELGVLLEGSNAAAVCRRSLRPGRQPPREMTRGSSRARPLDLVRIAPARRTCLDPRTLLRSAPCAPSARPAAGRTCPPSRPSAGTCQNYDRTRHLERGRQSHRAAAEPLRLHPAPPDRMDSWRSHASHFGDGER